MTRSGCPVLARILLLYLVLLALSPASGQTGSREMTTYSLQIQEDGSALWTVEFRTLLAGAADEIAFGNYTRDLRSVHLPEFQALMERSASQAAVTTGRPMQVRGFTSDSATQTVPTGTYGVVRYTFTTSSLPRRAPPCSTRPDGLWLRALLCAPRKMVPF